jgi:hypothetical protein
MTRRRGESLEGLRVVFVGKLREMVNDGRWDARQVDFAYAGGLEPVVALDVIQNSCRCGLGWVFLKRHQPGLPLPVRNLEQRIQRLARGRRNPSGDALEECSCRFPVAATDATSLSSVERAGAMIRHRRRASCADSIKSDER